MEGGKDYKKGLWTVEEDKILMEYIRVHGKGRWDRVAKFTGLKRCGKSCRLRWVNYLSPSIKRGGFSEEEDDLIIRLHKLLGNRWSLIAGRVPGRTDNQVKNHWNTHLSKKFWSNKSKSKGGSSSQTTISRKVREENNCNSVPALDSNSKNGGSDHLEQKANKAGCFEMEEPTMNEVYESSFCFSSDGFNFFDFNAPSLMTLLDYHEYSPEFIWHDL